MPPQQKQTFVQQLQVAKEENAKLRSQLDNLSTVDEDCRELRTENERLKGLLDQAKQAATANNNQGRVSDLTNEVNELTNRVRSLTHELEDAHQAINLYDSKLSGVSSLESQVSNLQRDLRNTIDQRDSVASSVARARQQAAEQIAIADKRATTLNQQLRDALARAQNAEAIVLEVRALIREQPDLLAAIRQKVGLQN